jgi:hypothetical protein
MRPHGSSLVGGSGSIFGGNDNLDAGIGSSGSLSAGSSGIFSDGTVSGNRMHNALKKRRKRKWGVIRGGYYLYLNACRS